MERSKLSLKWLEVFQAVSRRGSVRDGAADLGVSVSTVSQHITCLERAIGVTLFDHTRRPMRLTAEGETLLKRVDEAMWLLRKGVAEIWAEDLKSLVRVLRIAHIEDFDSDIGPEIADHLSRALPGCEFSILSRPSHEIMDLLQSEQVDIGIATSTEQDVTGLTEQPMLRDPYLLVTPLDVEPVFDINQLMPLSDDLYFLRYSKRLMIGRRIEAQLRRIGIRVPGRMEFESTQAILSLVAAGRGWTITTALNYARSREYHSRVRLMPFPAKPFARQISVFKRDDLPAGLQDLFAKVVRQSFQPLVFDPILAQHPWLSGQLRLLGEPGEGAVPTATPRSAPPDQPSA